MFEFDLYRLFVEFCNDDAFKNEFFLTDPSSSIARRIKEVQYRYITEYEQTENHVDYFFFEFYEFNILIKIDLGPIFDTEDTTDLFLEIPGSTNLVLQYELNPIGVTSTIENPDPFDEDEEFCVQNYQLDIQLPMI